MYQKHSINTITFFYCTLIILSITKSVNAQSSDPKLIYKAALNYFKTDTALSNNVNIPLRALRFAVHPSTIRTGFLNTLNNEMIFSPKADSIEKRLAMLDEKFNRYFKPQKIYLRNNLNKTNYTVFFSAIQDNMLYAELRYGDETDPNYSMGTVFCYRILLKDGEISDVTLGKLYLN